MSNSNLSSIQEEIAARASSLFGMKYWIASAYAKITTSPPTPNAGSSVDTLRACQKLLDDDSGAVDPLVLALAKEVQILNKIALPHHPNPKATMGQILVLLDLEHAEESQRQELLKTLFSYLGNHECSEDKNFKEWQHAVQEELTRD